MPSIKVIWHDHFGNRNNQTKADNKMLVFSSNFFHSVIAVNKELKIWNERNLNVKKVVYIPNFAVRQTEVTKTVLRGLAGKRIVCLSNLRHPKNHLALIQAFFQTDLWKEGWTLHLVGKDYNDAYSDALKKYIKDADAQSFIFIYGSAQDICNILEQSDVAVLASLYEGFPVTLLEYGLASLPVISTNVGECKEIIQNDESGFLIDPKDSQQIQTCLEKLCGNQSLRSNFAFNLNQFVKTNFSEEIVIPKVIEHYKSVL